MAGLLYISWGGIPSVKVTTGETQDGARVASWEMCLGPPRDVGGLKSQPQRDGASMRMEHQCPSLPQPGQQPLSFSASSRMCTIKQKRKIIRSERGLALSEMGQKVRLNPICQKTEGSGEGGVGGAKLELGRGRGAGDPPPMPLSTLSPNTGATM